MDGNTINTPSRTASPLYASILRLLRAQAGFAIENSIVAGMDEMRRLSCPGLVDIGLELLYRAGWAISAKPSCLQDDFFLTASQGQGAESAGLAHNMLRWGARPSANLGLLLDLALAVLELKVAVAKAPGLLGQESRPLGSVSGKLVSFMESEITPIGLVSSGNHHNTRRISSIAAIAATSKRQG